MSACSHDTEHDWALQVVALRKTLGGPVDEHRAVIRLRCKPCGHEFEFYPERNFGLSSDRRALQVTCRPASGLVLVPGFNGPRTSFTRG